MMRETRLFWRFVFLSHSHGLRLDALESWSTSWGWRVTMSFVLFALDDRSYANTTGRGLLRLLASLRTLEGRLFIFCRSGLIFV